MMKEGDKVVALEKLVAGIGTVEAGTIGVLCSHEAASPLQSKFRPLAAVYFSCLAGQGVMIVHTYKIRQLSALELLALEAGK